MGQFQTCLREAEVVLRILGFRNGPELRERVGIAPYWEQWGHVLFVAGSPLHVNFYVYTGLGVYRSRVLLGICYPVFS